MTVLGVDYGTKRIGLAVGDGATGMSFPLRSVPNGATKGGPDDGTAIDAVLDAARVETADRIVVGMPRRLDGTSDALGETELRVNAFIETLRARTALPIETEDERLTTAYVESIRVSAGGKSKDFDKDAAAAAAILETWLARNAMRAE